MPRLHPDTPPTGVPATWADRTAQPSPVPVTPVAPASAGAFAPGPAALPSFGQQVEAQGALAPQEAPTQFASQERPTAFVPAGRAPAIGQTFGTVSLPSRDADATAIQPFPGVGTVPPSFSPSLAATPTVVPASGVGPAVRDDDQPGTRWGSVGRWATAPSDAQSDHAADPDEDDDDDDAVRHPYTWLHMIALVAVAFILGMLVFMVVMQDDGDAAAAGAAAPAVVSAADPVVDGWGA